MTKKYAAKKMISIAIKINQIWFISHFLKDTTKKRF